MTSRNQPDLLNLKKSINLDDICLLCGFEVKDDDQHQLSCCKKKFDYKCLIKYLQFEQTYPNSRCPYCRQYFKSLPLKKGTSPMKYVHEEFYLKKKKRQLKKGIFPGICQGFKKDGSKCHFNAKVNGYCKKHSDQNKIKNCSGVYLTGSKKGTACSKLTSNANGYCHYHQPKDNKSKKKDNVKNKDNKSKSKSKSSNNSLAELVKVILVST